MFTLSQQLSPTPLVKMYYRFAKKEILFATPLYKIHNKLSQNLQSYINEYDRNLKGQDNG